MGAGSGGMLGSPMAKGSYRRAVNGRSVIERYSPDCLEKLFGK